MFYPTLPYIRDTSWWVFLMTVAASLSFDTFSKQWRLKPRKKRSFARRMFYLSLAAALYLSLHGCNLYFNVMVTNSDGEEMSLHEYVQVFLASDIWLDLKVSSLTGDPARNVEPFELSRRFHLVRLVSRQFGTKPSIKVSGQRGSSCSTSPTPRMK